MTTYDIKFWFSGLIKGMTGVLTGRLGLLEFLATHWQCTFIFYYLVFIFLLIIATAILTFQERQVLAGLQERKGPKKIGPGGSFQPVADALKLMQKEAIQVRFIKKNVFNIVASMAFFATLITWISLPFGFDIVMVTSDYSSFIIFNFSLLHIFSIVFAGWSSHSKYSSLGALRTTAQLVSYDLSIMSVYSFLFKIIKTLNLNEGQMENSKLGGFILFVLGICLIFLIANLAELSRHPFDLPEAESEIVGGYNTEYSSIKFAMFFLSEYLSLLSFAFLFNSLFFGASSIFFLLIKVIIIMYIVIKIRGIIPRYRYDQLMSLCWKALLPVLCSSLFFAIYLEYLVI